MGTEEQRTGPEPSPVRSPEPWVLPEDGACPVSHPVKAKVASGIFHLPGSTHYERTRPDRCYRDEAAAVADGLRGRGIRGRGRVLRLRRGAEPENEKTTEQRDDRFVRQLHADTSRVCGCP